MATLKDIAKIANVNISTVSKALRNSADLNETTISSIQAIADSLNYPYAAKMGGKKKNESLIGVIYPEIISDYYANVLNSLQTHLKKDGMRMLMMMSGFSEEEEVVCLKQMMKCNVGAVVCFTERNDGGERFRKIIEKHNLLFLLVSMSDDGDFCDSICVDDWQSAVIAVEHLICLGHKEIAYVGDQLSETRRKAYESTLTEHGIEVRPEYIFESNLRFEECGYMGMQQLLHCGKRFTGLFAAYDNIAIGAMRAIHEANLKIPQDISIVSIDDIRMARYLNVRLTTVTEPTQDLGELAANLLIMKIRGKWKTIQNIKLKPTLNIRETTAPPAG